MSNVEKKIIRRYIPIKYFDCFIKCNSLRLSDYNNWHNEKEFNYRCDECDYLMVSKYLSYLENNCNESNLRLGIMCFSDTTNEYSHWVRYADCCNGFCISFYKEELMNVLKSKYGNNVIGFNDVEYVQMGDGIEPISYSKLPFIKRKAYECESELRFITKLDSDNYFIRFTDEEMRKIVEKVIIGSCVKDIDKERMKLELKNKGIKCNISQVLNYSNWISFIMNNLEK